MSTATSPASVFDVDRRTLPPPPPAIADYVKREITMARPFEGPQNRKEPRHAVALRVMVIPTDGSLQLAGEPFLALTLNVSAGGIALVHTRAVRESLLAIEVEDPSGTRLRLLLEVLRCRPVMQFYEIAGRFVRRLG